MPSKKSLGARLGDSIPEPKAASEPQDIMDDHEAHSHLRTLVDAHAIRTNPDKMAKVRKLAGRHVEAIKSLSDLKDVYDQKYGAGAKDSDGDYDNG